LIKLLTRLRSWLAQPVSRSRALRIVAKARCVDRRQLTAFDQLKQGHVYRISNAPCWYVHLPWEDGWDGYCLRSSRVVLVSRLSGNILYDGSVNDEG
jgi:hypothetical protein